MATTSNLRINVLLLFCLLSFYSYGTAMMDYFLLYPSRYFVGEREFSSYHNFLEDAILPISVFPFLVIILLNSLLMWFKPVQLSTTLLGISLALLVVDLILTALFLAPWNFELGNAKNVILMNKITYVNWSRVFLESSQIIVVFIALKNYIKSLVTI